MANKTFANVLKLAFVRSRQKCLNTSASPSQKVMAKQPKLSVEALLD